MCIRDRGSKFYKSDTLSPNILWLDNILCPKKLFEDVIYSKHFQEMLFLSLFQFVLHFYHSLDPIVEQAYGYVYIPEMQVY